MSDASTTTATASNTNTNNDKKLETTVTNSSSSNIKSNTDILAKIPESAAMDLSKLDEASLEKLRGFIGKLYEYLSEEEQEYYKKKRLDQLKKQDETRDKFEKAVELASEKEMFEIPKGSGQHFKFKGYDSEQYVQLNTIANKADSIPKEQRGNPEYLALEVKTFKSMLIFSLEGITEEQINKIPLRELAWLYQVLKKKNEEPVPFLVNE